MMADRQHGLHGRNTVVRVLRDATDKALLDEYPGLETAIADVERAEAQLIEAIDEAKKMIDHLLSYPEGS